jgi:SAM-dependent methyltransferase
MLTLNIYCCIQRTLDQSICKGDLSFDQDRLVCNQCGHTYLVKNDVPVLKSNLSEAADTWFEGLYVNRSRTIELKNNYLLYEREFVREFVKIHHIQDRCLEIGCGVGLFAEVVPSFLGLEYALEALFAKGFEEFNRICADARFIPLIDSCIQCIFSFNTLEHVPDVDLAFSEMDRVLKPAGFLILKPAWHCTRYNTELIPILPYHQLNLRQKLVKFLLPLLTSKVYKFVTRIPWRLYRRLTKSQNNPLSWQRLTPYYGDLGKIPDCDAVASLDSHEAILFYETRGYACLSHPTQWQKLMAGHDVVVLQKPLS